MSEKVGGRKREREGREVERRKEGEKGGRERGSRGTEEEREGEGGGERKGKERKGGKRQWKVERKAIKRLLDHNQDGWLTGGHRCLSALLETGW